MARSWFGGTHLDVVVRPFTFGQRRLADLAADTEVKFWDAVEDGNQVTDLLLGGNNVGSVTTDPEGYLPQFQGPDGVRTMWADAGMGRRFLMLTTDGAIDLSTELSTRIPTSEKGQPSGVATLDAAGRVQESIDASNMDTGTVPEARLPSHLAEAALAETYVAEQPYTIAVIPDTQYLSQDYPAHFQALADYLTNNAEALNLGLILHVGDVVNKGITAQYDAAAPALADIFDIGVPVLAAIGNHDYDGAFDGGSPGHADTSLWNTYLGTSQYEAEDWFTGGFREAGKSENMYLTTTLGSRPLLVLSLEWGPRTATMDWADTVVADHPHHDVIVVTHSFLGIDGERVAPGDANAPGWTDSHTGTEMWNEYLHSWPNLIAVFNGHHLEGNLADRVDVTDSGSATFQQFANWQQETEGGQGRVVLYTVNPVNRTAHRRVYNPALVSFDTTAGYETVIRLGDTTPPAFHPYGTWQPYTPTCTWTVGNGILEGWFLHVGDVVDFEIRLDIGSTTVPSGSLDFGLPVGSDTHMMPIGDAVLADADGPEDFNARLRGAGSDVTVHDMNGGRVTDSSPQTWAAGDFIRLLGRYRATS